MKPQATGIRRASTFDGQRIDLSIDSNSLAHIMSVLTNLYSDPEMAVLREYSCNARDSHLASGNPDPIEVVLPSPLNPSLVIRDNGVGLSLDELSNLFSRYGASTKRESDTQTGMLGLGSKSALTYAPSFTMTAVKDGVKSEVLVSVKTDGAGTMTVMDTCATNERNGVTITIPTKPDNKFDEKAKELFSVWESGSVLVNGEVPAPIEGLLVGDSNDPVAILTKPTNSGYYRENKHRVVMGGVPYPLNKEFRSLIHDYAPYCDIVLFAPMGAVDFVPSREELHFTPRTNEALTKLIERFGQALHNQITKELNECQTPSEAMALANTWRSMSAFTHHNKVLPDPYVFAGNAIPKQFSGANLFYNPNRQWTSRKWSRETAVVAESLNNAVFVYGYTPESAPSATIRDRVAQWLSDNNHESRETLFFAPHDFIGEWSSAIVVDYETIKATKLPKNPNGATVKRTSSEHFDLVSGRLTNETPIDQINGDVAYYSATDISNDYYRTEVREYLNGIVSPKGYALVEVNKNRQAKFAREYNNGKAVALSDLLPEIFAGMYEELTDREIAVGQYQTSTRLDRLVLPSINDEALLREMNDYDECVRKVEKVATLVHGTYNRVFGHGSKPAHIGTRPQSSYALTLHSYPLLSGYNLHHQPEAVADYVNALYAVRGGGQS